MGQSGPVDLGIPGLEDAVLLGRGGFAVVYRAYQPAFRRTVAVKVVSVTHVDDLTRERFQRECQAMGLLSEHPSIVTVLEAGFLEDSRPFLVMAYMPEGSLQDRMQAGPIGWQEATRIGVKLAGALGTAHQAGVLHRDVKPANILVSQYGEPQLADFGIARVAGGRETSSGVITASLAYAPPEIVDGQRPTVASDVYSLAATLHALISGSAPFWREGEGSIAALLNRVMNHEPVDLIEFGAPSGVAEVLHQAMAKDAQERPPSAAQFGRLLRLAEDEQGLRPTQLTVYKPATAPPPRIDAQDEAPTDVLDEAEAAPTETISGDHVGFAETEPVPLPVVETPEPPPEQVSPEPQRTETEDVPVSAEPDAVVVSAATEDVVVSATTEDVPVSADSEASLASVASDDPAVPVGDADVDNDAGETTARRRWFDNRWLWPVVFVAAVLALLVTVFATRGGDDEPAGAAGTSEPPATTEQPGTSNEVGSTTGEPRAQPAARVESGFTFPTWWMADPDWAEAAIADHDTNSDSSFVRRPTGAQEWVSWESPAWTPDFVEGKMTFLLEVGERDVVNAAIEHKDVWRVPASSSEEFAAVFRLIPGYKYRVFLTAAEEPHRTVGVVDTGSGDLKLYAQQGEVYAEFEMDKPIALTTGRSYDVAIFAEGSGVFQVRVWPSGETQAADSSAVAGGSLDLGASWDNWTASGGWHPGVGVEPTGSISLDEYWGFELPGSGEAADAAPSAQIKVGMVFDIGGRGDKSYNDSAAVGLDRAVAELGVSSAEETANEDGSDREELLMSQAETSDLVIGVGFLFAEPMANAAAAYPDVNFAIVDDSSVDLPNVTELVFAENEGSFLVGVAAALQSQSGRIGFIGGVNIELIQRFEAGFAAGVDAVNPAITIDRRYLTEPPDFSGFNDAAAARAAALAMYESGADVVYHAAGGSGEGLFQAARDHSEATGSKVWAIGVDSDQYLSASEDVRDYILTSMMKRVDVAVFSTIEAQVSGEFAPGETVFDLATEGVGYATSGGFVSGFTETLEDYKARIVAGEIDVPIVP